MVDFAEIDNAAEIAERGGVQSVVVAARVLKALANGGGMLPLRTLAAATAMPRAKVHRYLASLKQAGLVAQDAESGEYRIGPAAVTIGLVGLGRTSPVRQVLAALPALRDRINETVTAAVWSERGPVVIAIEESDHVVTMNVRVGTVMPLAATAIGRLFLAFLPETMTKRLLAAERRADETPVPPREKLAEILAAIRREGFARIHGALLPGVDAVSVPVFDYRGGMVAAITAVGRFAALDAKAERALSQALLETARRISNGLGYSGPLR